MKIAFIYSTTKLSGKLTKFFTGSYCYHVGWVDEATDTFYDMNLIRRKRIWSSYSADKEIKLVDSPVSVSATYLEGQLLTDNNTYGWRDYLLFALRPIYHLFGLSTRNAGGVICSEMVYNDLVANGFSIHIDEVPSPADLERILVNER